MTHINAGRIVKQLSERWVGMPETRHASNAQQYEMKDAAMSAMGVFYTQCPSFLAGQRDMTQHKGRSNAHSLFLVKAIPSDEQTRNMLDGLDEKYFGEDYEWLYAQLKQGGKLDEFRDIGGTVLMGLDGTEFFSSEKVSCPHCLARKDVVGDVHCHHGAIVPVLVKSGRSEVLALMPEIIVKQDGSLKQDCEQNAAKRWLWKHSSNYEPRSVTCLGDDLYSHEPLCRQISEDCQQFFIFGAKPDSHTKLYEWLAYCAQINAIEQLQLRRWTGRSHEILTCRWMSGAPLTGSLDPVFVNGFELTITLEASGKVTYHNTWVTNHPVHCENIQQLADAGRTRWETENESHNILKRRGYDVDHNFGHGDDNLSAVQFTMNVLAFLIHTVQQWLDQPYQLLRKALATRQTFFDDLRALLRHQYFASWPELFGFMFDGLEIPIPPELQSSA